jgi:hypothetical protein
MPRESVRPRAVARRAVGVLGGWAAAVGLTLAGCARAPGPEVTPSAASQVAGLSPQATARLRSEILAALRQPGARVQAVRGRAEVRVSAPTWGGASWMEAAVVAERPARLRLRAYAGPATVFDVAADAVSFQLYIPGNEMVWSGPPDALPEITGFPGRPADVVASLLGTPFGVPDSVQLVAVDAQTATVCWPGPDGAEVRLRCGRQPLRAEEFRLVRGDSLVAVLTCADFLKESVGWWPRQWTLSWPGERATLALQFRQLELNPHVGPETFRLTPPEGALRIEMGTTSLGPPEGQ